MALAEAPAVEREIRIAARPDIVFGYFTDPEKMRRWKGVSAELDPRPGGIYRVNVTGREIARGEYLEVTPYSRIVFTWGWEGEGSPVPPGTSTVEVNFVLDGKGTLVRLVHRDLPVAEGAGHADGWEHFLPRLAIAATGGDPGPDPWSSTEEMTG
jgi:uncharacterized protein YndB with AHSA1/START domain